MICCFVCEKPKQEVIWTERIGMNLPLCAGCHLLTAPVIKVTSGFRIGSKNKDLVQAMTAQITNRVFTDAVITNLTHATTNTRYTWMDVAAEDADRIATATIEDDFDPVF